MFDAKSTHCGQYKRYGDFFREWDITTDQSKDETVQWALENLVKREIPDAATWSKETRDGQRHSGDANYYFRGYYAINSIEGGYHFKVCEPYCD